MPWHRPPAGRQAARAWRWSRADSSRRHLQCCRRFAADLQRTAFDIRVLGCSLLGSLAISRPGLFGSWATKAVFDAVQGTEHWPAATSLGARAFFGDSWRAAHENATCDVTKEMESKNRVHHVKVFKLVTV